MYEFRLIIRFYWRLFLNVELTISHPNPHQAIIWNNDGYFADAYMRHLAPMS